MENRIKEKATQKAEKLNQRVDETLDRLSPIDTGDYIKSHKSNLSIKTNKIILKRFNDSDNAFGVEFGFSKNKVNRHKKQYDGQPYSQRPIIYNGLGANVYQRLAKTIKSLLKKK